LAFNNEKGGACWGCAIIRNQSDAIKRRETSRHGGKKNSQLQAPLSIDGQWRTNKEIGGNVLTSVLKRVF
jgi:hypothetical protein